MKHPVVSTTDWTCTFTTSSLARCWIMSWNLLTCGSLVSMICSTTCFRNLSIGMLCTISTSKFLLDKMDHFNNFLLSPESVELVRQRLAPPLSDSASASLWATPTVSSVTRSWFPVFSSLLTRPRRSPRSFFRIFICELFLDRHVLRYHVCRETCVLDCLVRAALRPLGGCCGPPTASPFTGPQCTVGVLAGTHWSALRCPGRMASGAERQPFWLCGVGGNGHVLWTSCIHAFF